MERHPMLEVVIKSIPKLALSASTDKPLDYFNPLNRTRRFLNLERVYDRGVGFSRKAIGTQRQAKLLNRTFL